MTSDFHPLTGRPAGPPDLRNRMPLLHVFFLLVALACFVTAFYVELQSDLTKHQDSRRRTDASAYRLPPSNLQN